MSQALVIQIDRETVGIALEEPAGFRFFASQEIYFVLESRRFASLEGIRSACRQLQAATSAKPATSGGFLRQRTAGRASPPAQRPISAHGPARPMLAVRQGAG